ncbi:MAG: carbon monoxide dehydrogenase [Sulfobacillus benefaciens]|uniref:Carbon monoxide dehydrogenase n=1 Tax=Sulfobacillus benefaciens TaxID=453960 RepID=A0A2T2XLE7_9FIRM|nr:MAG: carbon monoxide dehydrogenase [Sulfobacillus benefaciens]
MKPAAFEYRRVTTVTEAVKLLRDAPDAKVIAGGQSLVPLMNFRLTRPSLLVDVNGIKALQHVVWDGTFLRIGSLVRHQQIADNVEIQKHCPVLTVAAKHIGHWAIRNRGTMGGSLAHADPASEWPAAAVALNAEIEVEGPQGVRMVPASEFYLGYYSTVLQPDELIVQIRIPSLKFRLGFAEMARRRGDFALAGAYVEDDGNGQGFVTWFGVADKPVRVPTVLPGNLEARREAWQQALGTLPIVDDKRSRIHLAVQIAERAWQHSQLEGAKYLSEEAIAGGDQPL